MKLFNRRRFETEMEAELRFHLDACVDDFVRQGVPREAAVRRARAEFGGVEGMKEECRRSWGLNHLDDLRADLRLTCRMLGRNRAFAAVAILSLALGIGANTAIFGLVDAVLLRVLPVRDPGSLFFLQAVGSEGPNGGPPYPCFEWLRDKTTSFEAVAAFSRPRWNSGSTGVASRPAACGPQAIYTRCSAYARDRPCTRRRRRPVGRRRRARAAPSR